jgi:hypothetical protein
MTEPDVTQVTRNDRYAELKVVMDILGMVGFLYYLSHPDVFERIGDKTRDIRKHIIHRMSVWTARQDIRSLPETDD